MINRHPRIRAICNGMKNFIPGWLHFVPRSPQAKRTLEMCLPAPAPLWPLLLWFSENAQMFRKGLENTRSAKF